jgi:hypothetical protein
MPQSKPGTLLRRLGRRKKIRLCGRGSTTWVETDGGPFKHVEGLATSERVTIMGSLARNRRRAAGSF